MKQLKKDNKGLGVVIGAIIIVAIIVVGILSWYVLANPSSWGEGNTDADDLDKDGDDKPDPIIGYIRVHAVITADNRQWIGDVVTWDISSMSAELVGEPAAMTFQPGGVFDQQKNMKVEFKVTQNTYLSIPWKVSNDYSWKVRGQTLETFQSDPDSTLGIRYHATYHVVVTLYDNSNGVEITSKAMDVNL